MKKLPRQCRPLYEPSPAEIDKVAAELRAKHFAEKVEAARHADDRLASASTAESVGAGSDIQGSLSRH